MLEFYLDIEFPTCASVAANVCRETKVKGMVAER